MQRRPIVLTGLVSAAAVVVAGCTGGEETAPTTTVVPTTTVPVTAAPEPVSALDLAEALASRRPAELQAALGLVVPGGPAARYLAHQAAARALLPDSAAATVTEVGLDADVCDTPTDCITIGGLDIDAATGLIWSFAIDGRPIDNRVTTNGLPTTVDGLDIAVRSAAIGHEGGLTIVIETRNTASVGIEWFGFASTYAAPGGLVVEATGSWGAETVPANDGGTLLLAFAEGQLPGQISLTGLRDDDIDITVNVEVPLPTQG